jgi:DNA-binding response OmpR family regulator
MRILVIEDEIKLANAIKRALKTQAHAVDVANSGEEGLELALSEDYDLIILDRMLPKLTGIEITHKLRSERVTTPILMLTAKGQLEDKITGLDAGADDYLVKPFSFEELFARMRALARRPTQVSAPVLQLDDLVLDPKTFAVSRDTRDIKLSTKEFALLEYMLRHQNEIISKEQLLTHVWDYDADVLPSTVEVHIKHLRDKIDLPFKTKLLHTHRGFGYQLRRP